MFGVEFVEFLDFEEFEDFLGFGDSASLNEEIGKAAIGSSYGFGIRRLEGFISILCEAANACL